MEHRRTRFMGVNPNDSRKFWKMVSDIKLREKHTVEEEVDAWKLFCCGCEKLSLEENSIYHSKFASFLKKLVIYKNDKQYRKDNFRSWPEGSFCTPTSAVTQIRNYMNGCQENAKKPLVLFTGQPEGIQVKPYEHCWVLVIWKTEDNYNIIVKDSKTIKQGAHASSFAKAIGKFLNVKKILLKEANPEDNLSDEGCVMRSFHFISDVMDGHWSIDSEHTQLPYYDKQSNYKILIY